MIRITVVMLAALAATPVLAAEWRPPEDYLTPSCEASVSKPMCDLARTEWVQDYRLAISGDYQGQRNVAFCLRDGCDGAVRPNPVLSCAWRQVILKAGHLDLASTDFSNVKLLCTPQKLGTDEAAAADAQARQILKMIASQPR